MARRLFGTHAYNLDFHACTCPDANRTNGRDLADGRAFCKHRLALLALREICADHLRDRTLGSYRGSGDYRHHLRHEPNAGHLIDEHGRVLYCHDAAAHIPAILCAFRGSPRGITPATEQDLAIYAEWLAQARPLSPAAAASVLFRRLIDAGRSREEAAAAADSALIARGCVEADAATAALLDRFGAANW